MDVSMHLQRKKNFCNNLIYNTVSSHWFIIHLNQIPTIITSITQNVQNCLRSPRSSSVKRLAGKPVAIFLHSCCNGIHFCTFPAALFLLARFFPLSSRRSFSRFAASFGRTQRSLARLEMKTSLKRALYALPSRSIFVRSFIPRHVFPARISRF